MGYLDLLEESGQCREECACRLDALRTKTQHHRERFVERWNRLAMSAAERRQRQISEKNERDSVRASRRHELWNAKAMAAEERCQRKAAATERKLERWNCAALRRQDRWHRKALAVEQRLQRLNGRDMLREDRWSNAVSRASRLAEERAVQCICRLLERWRRRKLKDLSRR